MVSNQYPELSSLLRLFQDEMKRKGEEGVDVKFYCLWLPHRQKLMKSYKFETEADVDVRGESRGERLECCGAGACGGGIVHGVGAVDLQQDDEHSVADE
jgi:hypothetical protein